MNTAVTMPAWVLGVWAAGYVACLLFLHFATKTPKP